MANREKVETVTDFIFFGPQITADGDCSHEIKRRLLLARKAMTNLFVVVQSLSHIWLFVTPWTAACQASCSSPSPGACSNSCPLSQWYRQTISYSDVPLSSCLQSFPSSVSFPLCESALHISWPKYWSFRFSINPSNEYSVLISFRIDCLDLLAAQGTLKSLLQHHNSKASLLQCSDFFMIQLTTIHDYWTNHSFNYADICQQSDVSAFYYTV